MKPTIERLHTLFRLEAGALIRRITTSNRCVAGKRAGTFDKSVGYRRVRVDGRVYLEHIVVFAMANGAWPAALVDHRSGDRLENEPTNLRDATRAVNQQNLRRARVDSKTGVLGVIAARGGFAAHIRVNGKQKKLGVFTTADEASAAYVEAKRRYHPGCTL